MVNKGGPFAFSITIMSLYFPDLPAGGTPWYVYTSVSGGVLVLVAVLFAVTCFFVTLRGRKRKNRAAIINKTRAKTKDGFAFDNPEYCTSTSSMELKFFK